MKKIFYIFILLSVISNPAFADTCSNCSVNEHNVYCVGFNSALMRMVGGENASQTTAVQGIAYLRNIGQGLYGERVLDFIAKGAEAFNNLCLITDMKSIDCQDTIKKCLPISEKANESFM